MKICHLTSVHPKHDVRIFHKYCKSVVANGDECHFVVGNAVDGIENGVHLHGINLKLSHRLIRVTFVAGLVALKAYRLKPDIYHFHDPELMPFALVLSMLGKKVIFDAHEDVPKQIMTKKWIPKIFRSMISKVYRIFEEYACSKYSLIVGATPPITKRFSDLGYSAITINNYPDINFIDGAKSAGRQKENIVCYVGLISYERGIREIVEMLDGMDIKLLLAGRFSSDAVRECVMKSKGWENVVELGFVERDKVADIMKRSLAGLVTLYPISNYIDSHPTKMFEYMVASTPVIASNFPLWREIVEGNKCGICVDPKDTKDILKAIRYLAENPDNAKEMGRNGRNAIIKKFNWGVEFEKAIIAYRELVV